MSEDITRINRDRRGGHMLSELPSEFVYNTGRQGRKAQKRWKMKKLRQEKTRIIASALNELEEERIAEEIDREMWYDDYGDDDWNRDDNDYRWDQYQMEMDELRDYCDDDSFEWAYQDDIYYNDDDSYFDER